MFDYTLTNNNSTPKGALEIDLRSRAQSRKMAVLTAESRKEVAASSRRSENPLKSLFASLFSFL